MNLSRKKQLQLIDKVVNDPERLRAVKATSLLNTLPEESFDRLTRLASKLLKTPISFVTLLENNRDFVKSHFGLPEPLATAREITAHPSFCQHIISHRQPLILEDARNNPLFNHFPSVIHMGVVAYAGIPLITPEGNALGTCCVLDFKPRKWTDDEIEILTELAQSVMTEINLRTLATKYEKEIKFKDEFLGIASHELKTPLTVLNVYTQLLQKKIGDDLDSDANVYVSKINNQLKKLGTLVTDLLDITRIEVGKLELRPEVFDLSKLVEEIAEDLEHSSDNHKILVSSNFNSKVKLDKERFTQVLTNLISNAIKYSGEATKINVVIEQIENDLQICVEDFGEGISKEDQKRIFERFFRSASTKRGSISGIGLGLYISSQIVERFGGRIWVESTEGVGSKFYFSLPLATLKVK